MKYYFFKTSNEMREGKMKPTLRALPGQTFENGIPVDTNLNVKAPKGEGQGVYGSREDYPIGTVFCSDYLEKNSDDRAPYYTVYSMFGSTPNFHPVSDDPNFNYVEPNHKSEIMNLAYTAFKNEMGMEESTEQEDERHDTPGASFIDQLLSDKRNAKPKDKDGFHVDILIWKVLVNNLYSKTNTLLLGPTGSGKTEVIKRLCQQTGTPLTIVPMGTISDPNVQLVGKLDIDSSTGGTKFDWADFALAIQKPGVILLDEINRVPKNGENLLFSCLDDTRMLPASEAKSSDQRTIKVHPECIFFATANIGNEYTGTKSIDRALRDRFMAVRMKYLDVATEKKILMARYGINDVDANNISFVANQIRIKALKDDLPAVSTRETLLCAKLVKNGFNCLGAMELVFLPMYDEGYGPYDATSEMAQIKTIIASRFNNQKTNEDGTEI